MKGRKQIIALLSAVLLLAGLVSGAGGSYEWCDECDGYSATELRNASENYTGDLYCSGCGRLIQKGQTIDLNEETQPEDPPAGNGEQAEETEKPQESTEPGEPTNETNPPEAETPNQPPAENPPGNASGQEEPAENPQEVPQQIPKENPETIPETPTKPAEEPEVPAVPETLPAEPETLRPEPEAELVTAPTETLPPEVPESPVEAETSATEETQSAPDEVPAANNPPAQEGGKKEAEVPKTRDLERYPVFSEKYPERRLNLPADPEAWAEFAGK